jgi:nucleoside-diphosphate-sugar epimerase
VDGLQRVLVTGADGKIGRAVVDDLIGRGLAVTALSLSWSAPSAADRVVTGDATDEPDVAGALADVDAVVHLAAIAHRDLAPPYEVFRTNTDATFNVLAQAGERGIRRAVIASSINAFGVPMHRERMLPAYFPIDEAIPYALDDWYSLSKRCDELTAEMAASRWDMAVVALRFPYVGTPDQVRRHAADVNHQQIREGWSYLDLRDAADVVHAGLVAPLSGAHVIGVSAPDTYRPEPTEDLLALHAPTVPLRRRVPGRGALIDTGRAHERLGFRARHSAGLAEPAGAVAVPSGEVDAR